MSPRTLRLLLSGLLLFPLPARAQPAPPLPRVRPPPRLAGIISVGRVHQAALESTHGRAGQWVLLGEGQREGGVTILGINPDKGTVRVRLGGTDEVTLALSNRTSLPAPGIVLEDSSLDQVLALYQWSVNRTLLRAPLSPRLSFTLSGVATNQAQAARLIERALAEQDIVTVPDGDKFMIVAPKEMESSLKAWPAKSKSVLRRGAGQPSSSAMNATAQTGSAPSRGPNQQVIPAGMLDFRNATLGQAMAIYAEMTAEVQPGRRPALYAPHQPDNSDSPGEGGGDIRPG